MYLHTHYFMDLRRPASRLEIVNIVLYALVVVFLLIGGLGMLIALPMRHGEPGFFALTGLFLLLAAVPCTVVAQLQGRRREWLRCSGFPVQGQIVQVTYHRFVNYGNQRHPWTVWCEYRYEGQTYTARSTYLWDRPAGQIARVFLDQERPGQAWVDPKSLEYDKTR